MKPTICVINECNKSVSDAEVQAAIPAFQQQISADFAPLWGVDATLAWTTDNNVAADAWWAVILENSDQAGALGYHDLTDHGMPISKIFAGTDVQYNEKWTVTATHELLEMLGDPWIDYAITLYDKDGNMSLIAYENCDAVEADTLGYDINGTTVSDFVLPSWFQPNSPGPWDFKGHTSTPLELLPGGYIGVWTQTGGWTQKTADAAPDYTKEPAERYWPNGTPVLTDAQRMAVAKARPPIGSRRERRMTKPELRTRSVATGKRRIDSSAS